MRILIATRRNRDAVEEAWASDAMRRCVTKYGEGSTLYDWEVDWDRPDGEPEKFPAAVKRVIPTFNVLVLIEQDNGSGCLVIGRGQHRCAEVALQNGLKVYVYREGAFLLVQGLRVSNPKVWKEGYATVAV